MPDKVKARRHTPNQVIRKLREAERLLGEAPANWTPIVKNCR